MAPFVENYSNTLKVNYTCPGHPYKHSFQVHYGVVPAPPPNGLKAIIDEFLSSLSAILMTGWAIQSAEYRVAGSGVFLPEPMTQPGIPPAGGAQPIGYRPRYYRWEGVNQNGRRTSLRLFGVVGFTPDTTEQADYRVNGTELTAIADSVAVLNSGSDFITCIDGVSAQWRNYVNYKDDDNMVEALRG